jgi:hypothetical protein
MSGDELHETAQRIADAGLADVTARLRASLESRAAADGVPLEPAELDRLAAEGASRAGGALWRRALAAAAVQELGIGLAEAITHPAVVRAHQLVGAPPYEARAPAPAAPGPPAVAPAPPPRAVPARAASPAPPRLPASTPPPPSARPVAPRAPGPDAVRVPAVHISGIESLKAGEDDLELRISPAGLDVLKRSNGAAIGRLEWSDIKAVELPRAKRGLRPGRRRNQEMHVATGRGRASFELPGLTEEQLKEHLEPMLARTRGGGSGQDR